MSAIVQYSFLLVLFVIDFSLVYLCTVTKHTLSIGLAVCRKLIDIMGGAIVLDEHYRSGIDGCPGACFSVILNRPPLALDTATAANTTANTAAITAATTAADPSKEHTTSLSTLAGPTPEDVGKLPETCSVLFVDDDTLLRRLISRSLSQVMPQWTIQQAANGETALELVANNKYGIIFMDQYMASVEKQLLGTEAVRAMRGRGVTSVICGLSANDSKESFLKAGADTFVLKPFPCKREKLLEALQHVWGCRSVIDTIPANKDDEKTDEPTSHGTGVE